MTSVFPPKCTELKVDEGNFVSILWKKRDSSSSSSDTENREKVPVFEYLHPVLGL